MGNQLEKFYYARHQVIDHEPEKNDEKMDGDNAESAEEIELKSITNICYDVLERIFDLLDLESLLHVAQTCKHLQIAAATKYRKKYGKKRIFVSADLMCGYEKQGIYKYKNETNFIIGMKFCLPLLRCFGENILFLGVQNSDRIACNDYMHQYINQYCADTLNNILFFGKAESSNESFPKPFKNVQLVCSHHSGIMKQLPNFVNLFPNLRRLQIGGCSIRDNISTAVLLPLLEHLGIDFTCDLAEKSVTDLLHANKQLQSIKFSFGNYSKLTMSKLLDMISGNKLISELMVTKRNNTVIDVNASELLRLASEHLTLIKLDLQPCLLEVDDAIAFIGILNSLKLFKFQVENHSEYDRLLSKLDSEWKHELSIDEDNIGHHIITLAH